MNLFKRHYKRSRASGIPAASHGPEGHPTAYEGHMKGIPRHTKGISASDICRWFVCQSGRDVLDVEKVILHSGGYILSDVKYILSDVKYIL